LRFFTPEGLLTIGVNNPIFFVIGRKRAQQGGFKRGRMGGLGPLRGDQGEFLTSGGVKFPV